MTSKNNSGDWNSGYWNSGYWNSGNSNSGNSNSGNRNSGDWNSGNSNSGCFNTNEPYARFFNKPTKIKLSEFYQSDAFPDLSDFPLNRWIDKDDMTKKEKEETSGWETMGGYLKTLNYKEAWKVFWQETTEENRQKFLNLPNFDAKIFKEITGIDVNDNKTEKKQEMLDKAQELIDKAEELKQKAEEL
jgi:hypothetical protein